MLPKLNLEPDENMHLFEPLADRAYRHLFLAQVLSLLGTGMTTVALALLAYELAGANAGAVLGTALALKMVAYVGIAPIAGAYAGRFPRRAFLVTLDLVRALIVLALPFVTEIWQIYVLIFVLQSCSAAFTPTFQATIPDILADEKRYTQALSLSRLAYDTEALVSPVLAALLLSVMSYHWLFLGNVAGFIASGLLVLSVALPIAKRSVISGGVWSRTTRGMRIYLATPRLRGLLALNLAVAAGGAMVIVNTVVLVRASLMGGDASVALLMAAYGGGSMLAALALPRVLEAVPERNLMLGGAAALGFGLLGAASGLSWTIALPLWALMGIGGSLVQTPGGRLLRRSSHAEDRPALFAAHFALSHACWLITYPLAGWAGARFGLLVAALALLMVVGAGIILAAWLWPAHDPEIVAHTHATLVHDHPHLDDGHHGTGDNAHGTHRHEPLRHAHAFVIDDHHPVWPVAR